MLAANLMTLGLWLFQEAEVGFDPISMWRAMGWPARLVVIVLFIMSAWSIGVMIDRWIAFSSARKQSRVFAPAVAGALKDGKIDEAISIAEQNKRSHLAKVVTAGLQEFQAHQVFDGNLRRDHRSVQAGPGTGFCHRTRRAEARRLHPGHYRLHGAFRGAVRHRAGHHPRV